MRILEDYSAEQIQSARVYAAAIHYRIAEQAKNDTLGFASHVTPQRKRDYAAKELREARAIERGFRDHNFTVWQRMVYHLTGESIPFLPK